VYRPPPEQRQQQEPEYVTFQYTDQQEQFRRHVLQAHNKLATDIRHTVLPVGYHFLPFVTHTP
jgi:hypothetical protein